MCADDIGPKIAAVHAPCGCAGSCFADARTTGPLDFRERASAPRRLPDAAQLAALGSVLCLYRYDDTPPVRWWAAGRARVHACVDATGAREWVSVHGASGHDARAREDDADDDRLRFYLLPDTDFLAWERMTATLASAATQRAAAVQSLHARLLTRVAARVRRARWQALPLRLQAQPGAGGWRLTALPVDLSPLGRRVAETIARCEGAEWRHGRHSNGHDVGDRHHDGHGAGSGSEEASRPEPDRSTTTTTATTTTATATATATATDDPITVAPFFHPHV